MVSHPVDRRQQLRWPLRLPARVQGRDPDRSVFEEMASCEDASAGGVSLCLLHPVRQGQALHLSLPLPPRLRQYDVTSQAYQVYSLVRSVVPAAGRGARVGVLFYGRTPPEGAESLPEGLFLMPGDPTPAGKQLRHGVPLMLHLHASQAPGGLAREEQTAAEKVSAWGARVRVASLPVMKGTIVSVEEVGGSFRTRAEVHHILIGSDGDPHLELVFLDNPAPEHLRADRADQ